MYHELHGGGRREAAVDTPAAGSEHEGVGEEGRSKPRDHREARERSSTRAPRNSTQACRGPRSGGRGPVWEEVRRGASRLGPRLALQRLFHSTGGYSCSLCSRGTSISLARWAALWLFSMTALKNSTSSWSPSFSASWA